MRQYTIHIPVIFNSGQVVPKELYSNMRERALDYFGGYSWDEAEIAGAWVDEGQVYAEPMRRLIVATDDFAKLQKYVAFLKTTFDQLAMYVVDNGPVHFM